MKKPPPALIVLRRRKASFAAFRPARSFTQAASSRRNSAAENASSRFSRTRASAISARSGFLNQAGKRSSLHDVLIWHLSGWAEPSAFLIDENIRRYRPALSRPTVLTPRTKQAAL